MASLPEIYSGAMGYNLDQTTAIKQNQSQIQQNQDRPLETDGFHVNAKIWLVGNRASFQVANMSLSKSLSPHATKTNNPVRKATNYIT